MSRLQLPEGMTPASFLSEFWQKRPLLIRGAYAGLQPPISPEELAGLACEEEVESRIVLEKDGVRPWEARLGPFDEEDFAGLPESHWTLLVQDMDKHHPGVARLLDDYRFIPDWRMDDIMISYAADQGTVGPHVDDYDVFLIQVEGRKRWRIHTREVAEDDYLPGLDLRILPEFHTEQEWVLEPGDLLYLPPNVAHWGIAEGESVTYSVGFRAPSEREMLASWCDYQLEHHASDHRYRDPELHPAEHSAEIDAVSLEGVRQALLTLLQADPEDTAHWFGRFISEVKPNLQAEPREEPLDEIRLRRRFEESSPLRRNPHSRLLFRRGGRDRDYLYVNGEEFTHPAGHGRFLEELCRLRELHIGFIEQWLECADCLTLLTHLYNSGHYRFDDE